MKIRVAVVGLGKMGLMHSCVLNTLNDVELVALCEKNALVRRFGKKIIPSIDIVESLDLLTKIKLDALFVTTPPASHFSIIKSCYEKGIAKHIFTEKPLAVNNIQAEKLIRFAESAGNVNMVGYHRRFSVTFGKAKQLLESGVIGNVQSFKGHAYSADFLGAKTTKQAISRGGVIEDSGCHVIDIALWMLGDMETIGADVESLIGKGSEDQAFIEVKTLGGIKGELNVSWCKEGYRLPDMCLVLSGDRGTLTVNEDNVQVSANGKINVWYKHDLNDYVPFFIGGSEYQREDELFIRAIQLGNKVQPDFRAAAKVNRLVDTAIQIARGERE